MKVLITGAGGFLGQYIAQALQDHEVTAATRSELNLADAPAVQHHFAHNAYDAVIHCAAAGRNTPMAQDRSIVSNNLAAVINLLAHRHAFGKLINIGTGAEFDVSQPIDQAQEADIFDCSPSQSYGQSKNIIARYLTTQPNCTTLRLFGCFDDSEDSRRLLKKFHSEALLGHRFDIQDRWFDMISAKDFVTVVRAVLNNNVHDSNINCVYAQKRRLSEILSVYCNEHRLDPDLINVVGTGLDYTGDSRVLDQYSLELDGLDKSLKLYEFSRK